MHQGTELSKPDSARWPLNESEELRTLPRDVSRPTTGTWPYSPRGPPSLAPLQVRSERGQGQEAEQAAPGLWERSV